MTELFRNFGSPESEPAAVADTCASIASDAQDAGKNTAVEILWAALGGDGDNNVYERVSTRTHKGGRVDDTTIMVIPL